MGEKPTCARRRTHARERIDGGAEEQIRMAMVEARPDTTRKREP